MDCSSPGSFVHGILQARILEWVACLPPRDLPDPGNQTLSLTSPALAGRFFNTSTTWEAPSVLTMDYYSATKRNNWLQHGWTLKTCLAKTARHRQSHIVWSLCYGLSRVGKSTETESRFAVAKSWETRLGMFWGGWECSGISADGCNGSVAVCCLVAKSRRTPCDLHQAPRSMGFSREEHWSGLHDLSFLNVEF